MPSGFGGFGQVPSQRGLVTNTLSLPSGATYQFPTGGAFSVKTGKYTSLQTYDPILQAWRNPGGGNTDAVQNFTTQDGEVWRLANQTGCAVGALLTNGGSNYTTAPTVTASAGNSTWRAVVGGAVNTTVTIVNGGTGYTYPPIVLFAAPPPGGVQATGHATLSGSAVASVVVDDQGAGYASPPAITFVNDYREILLASNITTGSGASAVCTLTGANTVTAVICVDHGVGGQTAVPTLSFSGGGGSGAAATAIMCWSITGVTPTGGTGFTTAEVYGLDAFPTTAPAYTNPTTQANLVKTRRAWIKMLQSGGAPTATGLVIYDGGIYTSVPTAIVNTGGTLITASTSIAFTMGGQTDVSELLIP